MSASNPPAMHIVFDTHGTGHCIYDETLNLKKIGELQIRRGSHVEPDGTGRWTADMAPVGGPFLGPFSRRSVALQAERAWLEIFWLQREQHPAQPIAPS